MRREDKFVMSHRPYAVDMGSLRTTYHPVRDSDPRSHEFWRCEIDAVWFRRRNGLTVACIGTLWDIQHMEPPDAESMLLRYTDGRYGGNAHGRWDGSGYWGDEQPEIREAHLDVLVPMLAEFPQIPVCFDGWYTFHEKRTR